MSPWWLVVAFGVGVLVGAGMCVDGTIRVLRMAREEARRAAGEAKTKTMEEALAAARAAANLCEK